MKFAVALILFLYPTLAAGAPASVPATTQAAALPEPTRVTLKFAHAPPVDALASLFKQAGIPDHGLLHSAFVESTRNRTVTINIVNQPYATALLEICRQARLEPSDSRAPGRPLFLQILPPTTEPSWIDGPAVASGPFTFVAREAVRTSHIELETGVNTRRLTLQIIVLRDPLAQLFQMAGELEIEEAKDDHGHSLLVARPPGIPPIAAPLVSDRGQWIWNASATLNYPPAGSHTIALLRGRLHTAMVTRSEPTELINAKGPVLGARNAGDIHFNVKSLDKTGDSARLAMSVNPLDGEDELGKFRGVMQSSDFHATDATSGSYFVNVQMSPAVQPSGFHEGVVEFRGFHGRSGDPKPALVPSLVVWNVPVEVSDVEIPVEFHDLPLP